MNHVEVYLTGGPLDGFTYLTPSCSEAPRTIMPDAFFGYPVWKQMEKDWRLHAHAVYWRTSETRRGVPVYEHLGWTSDPKEVEVFKVKRDARKRRG